MAPSYLCVGTLYTNINLTNSLTNSLITNVSLSTYPPVPNPYQTRTKSVPNPYQTQTKHTLSSSIGPIVSAIPTVLFSLSIKYSGSLV